LQDAAFRASELGLKGAHRRHQPQPRAAL